MTLDAVIDMVPHEADAKMETCVQEVYWMVHGEARAVGKCARPIRRNWRGAAGHYENALISKLDVRKYSVVHN